MFRQLAQWCDHVVSRDPLGRSRVNSDASENVRVFFRQFDRPPATFHRRADGYNTCYTRLGRAAKDVLEISCEIGIIEMRVRFDQHCRGLERRGAFAPVILRRRRGISDHA